MSKKEDLLIWCYKNTSWWDFDNSTDLENMTEKELIMLKKQIEESEGK